MSVRVYFLLYRLDAGQNLAFFPFRQVAPAALQKSPGKTAPKPTGTPPLIFAIRRQLTPAQALGASFFGAVAASFAGTPRPTAAAGQPT